MIDKNKVKKENAGLQLKYFVLKPRGCNPYANAARAAMLTFADCIEKHNPILAQDLRAWVKNEEGKAKGE